MMFIFSTKLENKTTNYHLI